MLDGRKKNIHDKPSLYFCLQSVLIPLCIVTVESFFFLLGIMSRKIFSLNITNSKGINGEATILSFHDDDDDNNDNDNTDDFWGRKSKV